MKKFFSTVATLALVFFAGCTNDTTADVKPVTGGTTLTVGTATSRTYLGELVEGKRSVYWSEDDQIMVGEQTSTYIVVDGENKGLATFGFTNEVTYPCNILYPAEAYKDASTITLPAIQESATGSFGVDAAPMAVVADGLATPVLKHLAGAVRIRLVAGTEEHDDIVKVSVKGGNNEQMSGDFAIDYAAATLTETSTDEANQVVSAKVYKSLSAETTDVFVVVPANNYTNGFTVTVYDRSGHYMEVTKASGVTIGAGEIYALPEVAFNPTGTDIGVEISSAADLVAFAERYNAFEFDGVIPFIVNITDDIVFDDTTNAAWAEIGGIGVNAANASDGADHFFHGIFNGNGKSIKNWVSTAPLFAYSKAGSNIYNLTIDSSCTLTPNVTLPYYGAFVGYLRGTLSNCHSNAAMTISGTTTGDTEIGGLVGRVVVGSVEECSMNGDITATTEFTYNQKFYLGGIAGRIENENGLIDSSTTSSNINVYCNGSDRSKEASAHIGCIVGNTEGNCSNCSTASGKKLYVSNLDKTDNHITTLYIGGIAGSISSEKTSSGKVDACHNYTSIQVKWVYDSANDYSRYLHLGGITSYTYGTISNCTNNATVQSRASQRTQNIGGISGSADGGATITGCTTNAGDITARKPDSGNQARYLTIGGTVGHCKTSNVSNLNNKAFVAVSLLDSNASTTADIGGIFGRFEGTSINGTSEHKIMNNGNVEYNWNSDNNYAYIAVGGIAGQLTKATTVQYAENTGLISLISQTGSNLARTNYCGGIIGVTKSAGCTIQNCINTNQLKNMSRHNKVSYEDTTAAPLTAELGFFNGGIVAFMHGEEGTRSTISNCQNTCTAKYNASDVTNGIHMNRGCAGGICGYAKYTDITNCSSSAGLSGTNTSIKLGGIAGYLDNSNVNECHVVNAELTSVNNTYLGGIASCVNAGSSVKNSTFTGVLNVITTNYASACVAATTKAGAVISNCGIAGTVFGETVTTDNFASYLVGDSNTTPTWCYHYTAE